MGAQITKVGYKRAGYPSGAELPFLIGNTGESYLATIEFEIQFSFVSSFNRPCFWKDSAFEMLGGEWADEGFNVGDVVNVGIYEENGSTIFVGSTTILFIDGNRLVVSDSTTALLNLSPFLTNDTMYPDGQTTGTININVAKNPQGIGIRFNLIDNEQPGSIFSIYGGLAPYYRWQNVASMAVGDMVQMDFLGWRSGGNIERCRLYRLANPADIFGLKRKFRIEVLFNSWGWFENGNEDGEPSFFDLNKCLKPYFEIDIFPQNSNPNTNIKLKNNALQANSGWFDQNNNVDGQPNYKVKNIQFTILGNPVSGIDYSTTTQVRVTFDALAQNQINSFFSYGMLYVPRDASVYQEKYGWLGEHLMLSNGGWNKIYQNQTFPDPAIQGYTNPDNGARLATQNVYFQVNAPLNEVYLDFDVIPNAAATTFFEGREDGDREVIIYASIGNSFQTSEPLTDDRVTVLAYRGQLEKQPIIAGPYDKVDFTGFYQHPNVDGDILNPDEVDTFKEDDVMYRVDFRLEKGANVQSLTAQIDKNGLNPLERFIINTEGLPVLNDGTIHIDYANFRNYRVPQDIQSRRKVVLKRNPALDTLTDAGYTLEYGFLSRWEYWIANQNVPLTYFNPALPNNGLNNDWILFEPLNVRLLIEIDGLSYFVEGDLTINDYDSSADVTSMHQLFLLDGVTPVGALLAGEELIVRATHTKTSAWDQNSVWGWIKAENRESNAYARISSVWDWNTIDKPFRPLTGETKCKLSFPSANVAVLETVVVVDEIINTGFADFTSRIEGERINPINAKLMENGIYKVTENNQLKIIE
jgi:hypothetical protein